MEEETRLKLNKTDAWIFLAVARSDGAPLESLISAADHINCALPTFEELQSSVQRLIVTDLIALDADLLALTDNGRVAFDNVGGLAAFPRPQVAAVLPFLQDYADGVSEECAVAAATLDPLAYSRAKAQYTKKMAGISKAMRQKR